MLESLLERWGESGGLAAGALLIGIAFGFLAQRSRFCLRSAVIEFARNLSGGKLTVWLFAFASAALTDRPLDQRAASPLDQSMPSASVGAR